MRAEREAMGRKAAECIKLECRGADVEIRTYWAGLMEVVCGESRVMICYSGPERLAKLKPEDAMLQLRNLLELARAERRNRAGAEEILTRFAL